MSEIKIDYDDGIVVTLLQGRRETRWLIGEDHALEDFADILDAAGYYDKPTPSQAVAHPPETLGTVSAYEPLPVTQGVSWSTATGENPEMESLPIF